MSRVENGFVWRDGRLVKERVTAWDGLRLARAAIICGSTWTSRFVRDHKAVEAGRFGLGDRGGLLLRYYRKTALLRPWKRFGGSGSTVDPSRSMRDFGATIRRQFFRVQLPRTPRRRQVIRMSPSVPPARHGKPYSTCGDGSAGGGASSRGTDGEGAATIQAWP